MTWPEELSFSSAPPHHRLGLRSCPEDRWLLGGDDLAEQLRAKAAIVAERHDDVVQALPGSERACAELVEVVADWLRRYRPAGPSVERAPELHPVDVAARPVAEDLCVLERRDDGWVLTAASLAFPSRWQLADKLGRTVTVIHDPVPHYASEVGAAVDRFLDRLRPGPISWRRNLSLHATDRLFEPVREPRAAPCPPAQLWLRSERQTLRRLPLTGAVVFTIRTQQLPVPDVGAEVRRRLADWLADLDEPLVAYKTGDFDVEDTVAWLRHGLRDLRHLSGGRQE